MPGTMQEQRYDDRGLGFDAQNPRLQAADDEAADRSAQKAGEPCRVLRGERACVDALLNERGQRTLDVGHATNGLAVEVRLRRGARSPEEPVLEGHEKERPMTIHIREEAREPDRKLFFERRGIPGRRRQLPAKGFTALLEKSA